MQCCLEPPGQHSLGLNAMLFLEYYNNIEQDVFLCNGVWNLKDNIA